MLALKFFTANYCIKIYFPQPKAILSYVAKEPITID